MNPIPQMEPWFDESEAKAVYDYVKSGGWLTEFKKTEELEQLLANYTGAKHCVMTVNGTVTLILALLALDIKPDDEVLVPDLTMIASPNAVVMTGAKPVLVDIEPETLGMDLKKAEELITPKTKALMYVPLNGRSGNMQEVIDFCKRRNISLVEDAAQTLGSKYMGQHYGSFGDIGSFSFSAQKIISTGQGGALTTNSDELAKKIRRLKDFGRSQGGNDIHDYWGWNFKFTDLQAVVGIEQMKKLDTRVKRKKEIYKRYEDALSQVDGISFIPTDLDNTAPWFVDIYVSDPDGLQNHLRKQEIGTRRIYPAIHTQKIYAPNYQTADFPITNKFTSQGLWLPSSSQLSDEDIDRVTNTIINYYH